MRCIVFQLLIRIPAGLVFCMALSSSTTRASSLPADLNRDGVVDQYDVEVVQQSLGARDPNIISIQGARGGSFILDQAGKTYVLQGPTTGHIVIQADRLVLDLNNNEVNNLSSGVAGITVQDRDGITIKNGRIRSIAAGITILNSNDIHLEHLTVQNCFKEGIVATSSNHLLLGPVTCKNNYHGMSFSKIQNIVVVDCETSENRDIGILCTQCKTGTFERIVVQENATDGLDFTDCSNIHLHGIRALHNKDDGIDIRNTTQASVSASVSDNDGPDLELEGGSDVIVRDSQYLGSLESEHLIGFNIVRRFSSLNVRVVDDQDLPFMGARVRLYNENRSATGDLLQTDWEFSLMTDYQGRLPALDVLWYTNIGNVVTYSGPYRVQVSHPYFQTVEWSFDARAPLEKTLVIRP